MADGIGRGPRLDLGARELVGRFLQSPPNDLVRLKEPLSARSQGLDLSDRHVALFGKCAQDLLAHHLSAFDHGVALGFGLSPDRLGLLADLVDKPLTLGPSGFFDARRDPFCFVGPSSQDGLGLRTHRVRLVMRLLQDPGSIFLRPGLDVACGFMGAFQDVGGFVANGTEERVLVERWMGGSVFGVAARILEGGLALVERDDLRRHLDQEGTHLLRIEAATAGTKVLLGDEVR
jgi:hypothetical protein